MVLGQFYPQLISPFAHGIELRPDRGYSYIGALYNIIVCASVGIIVSLFTKPESDKKLKGLTIFDAAKLKGIYKGSAPNEAIGEKIIVDWKTNKRISEESFGNKKGILNSTQHLDDCNFIHYSLQLSFYRYILENYYGLKVGSQTLFHLKQDKFKTYSVNYHEDDLVNMLKEKELL
mgnify:CR=1 FL=1